MVSEVSSLDAFLIACCQTYRYLSESHEPPGVTPMLLNASSRFPRGLSQVGRRLLQILFRLRLFFKPSFTFSLAANR
jgi:hypothetical protein